VWRAGLDRPQRVRERLARDLSDEECGRAARIAPESARRRWLVGRALLRQVLGRYLAASPETLSLVTEPGGKLVLDGAAPPLAFNLSHSGSVALYAITGGERVGVDVERVRGGIDTARVAERLFSVTERAALDDLPPDRRRAAFFSCWTRREAYAKGVGTGLRLRPAKAADGWSLWGLDPVRGYAGAVAVEGRDLELRCWDLTDPAGSLPLGV
jgi:4'-phosphopantetheinyl transferase